MPATVKLGSNGPAQVLKWRLIDVTLDNSYPAGGYALAAADFGLTTLHAVIPMPAASGYVTQFNPSTGKLVIYNASAHTHTENTAAAYTQNATTASAAAAALAEVTAGANLSAVTVRVFGLGE